MARTSQFEGEVAAKSRAGTGIAFNLDGEDTWFNAKDAEQIPEDVEKGDIVSFEYTTSAKGGRTFNNIQGDVELVEKGKGGGQSRGASGGRSRGAPARSGGAPSRAPARSAGGGGGIDRRDVQIVRQNALTQANKLVETFPELADNSGPEEAAASIIELAKAFEAFVFS